MIFVFNPIELDLVSRTLHDYSQPKRGNRIARGPGKLLLISGATEA